MNTFQHYQLLLRTPRSLALRRIIQQVVQSGSLVLDAGCGSGILSVWAAQMGATVVAVDIADLSLARALAEENAVADRITFIEGNLHDIGLEEHGPFNVLLAMLYLNDPRRDMAASHLAHSLKRYLAKDAVIVPDKVIYTAQAIECPSQDQQRRLTTFDEDISSLEAAYGIRMETFRHKLGLSPTQGMFPHRDGDGKVDLPDAKELGEPLIHHLVDYHGEEVRWPSRVVLPIRRDGRLTTILWQQELQFRNELIFRNGSIGWVYPSPAVTKNTQMQLATGAEWLKSNVLRPI
jgi:predicted RNA methylase